MMRLDALGGKRPPCVLLNHFDDTPSAVTGSLLILLEWRYSDGPMRYRGILLLILAASVGVLSALAYASPTDPTWIAGLYDGGDADDAVFLARSIAGLPEPLLVAPAGPSGVVVGFIALADAADPVTAASPAFSVRAPPLV